MQKATERRYNGAASRRPLAAFSADFADAQAYKSVNYPWWRSMPMMPIVFVPIFALWFVTYIVAKYPALAVGRLVVRFSPNILFDASICVALTLLCWYLVFGLIAIYTTEQRDQHPLIEIGTMVALGLGPPLLVAFFKGTLRERSILKAL